MFTPVHVSNDLQYYGLHVNESYPKFNYKVIGNAVIFQVMRAPLRELHHGNDGACTPSWEVRACGIYDLFNPGANPNNISQFKKKYFVLLVSIKRFLPFVCKKKSKFKTFPESDLFIHMREREGINVIANYFFHKIMVEYGRDN